MTDLSPLTISLLMFGTMVGIMLSGLPLTFSLGAVGVGFALWLWGPAAIDLTYFATTELMSNSLLLAAPLFIFTGLALRSSGIIDNLFNMIYLWSGRVRGGLGIGTILVSMLVAAMCPGVGAAQLTLGLVCLPPMLKRNYSKRLASGCIQAGGALGFLIPPSLTMIIIAFISGQSLAKLFAGGVMPGILLGSIFMTYIAIRCWRNPKLGPALPPEERATWKEKFISLRAVILPMAVIGTVIALIIAGITSVTEASAVGAMGALICCAIQRRLSWNMLKQTLSDTTRLTGIVFWIVLAAFAFSKVYIGLGAPQMIESFMLGLEASRWFVIGIMMGSFFILGMFLDDAAIMFICLPIYIPVIVQLGFDPLWFAILYVVNIQMAYLTPPLGYNLFLLKAVAPPEVTMRDIIVSIIPFVGLQAAGLATIILFPQIALWLPNTVFGG